jgi:hypothetical protein
LTWLKHPPASKERSIYAQITIPKTLMTTGEGDLIGLISSSGFDNYCRLKKIVCKIFSNILENVKSFSERFF